MTVLRDEWGIPHLRADSVLELAFAQGHNAARDRGEQIELDRLHAEGRTAEVTGPGGLGWDTFARQSLLDETARRCFERLDDETRAWCEAYVDGVRAGLTKRRPGGWAPWTPLGIFPIFC